MGVEGEVSGRGAMTVAASVCCSCSFAASLAFFCLFLLQHVQQHVACCKVLQLVRAYACVAFNLFLHLNALLLVFGFFCAFSSF